MVRKQRFRIAPLKTGSRLYHYILSTSYDQWDDIIPLRIALWSMIRASQKTLPTFIRWRKGKLHSLVFWLSTYVKRVFWITHIVALDFCLPIAYTTKSRISYLSNYHGLGHFKKVRANHIPYLPYTLGCNSCADFIQSSLTFFWWWWLTIITRLWSFSKIEQNLWQRQRD